MENRFGLRDLVVCFLLLCLITLVVLAMFQFDRQWQRINAVDNVLGEHTRDLARIRSLLEQAPAPGSVPTRANSLPSDSAPGSAGGYSPTTAPSAAATPRDPFDRVRAAQKMPGYALGDHYVTNFSVVPDRLTPLVSVDGYSSDVQSYVQESLADRDPDTLAWRPVLSTGWRISPDGLRIEFDVRYGVTFSDGEPFSADDVVYTFNLIMNPQIEAPRLRAYYQKIQAVEKLDDDTVVFIFKEPYFKAFEFAGGMPIMPKHFYEKYTPTEFNQSTGLLMGTGPYRLADPTSWRPEPGKPIELVRNDRYWGQPPPFDKVVWRIIENDAARLTTFTNGETDDFTATPEQYLTLQKDQQLLSRTTHFEYFSPVYGYIYIGWNQRRNGQPTPFADVRVRRAMTMLTDRQRVIDEAYYGYGRVVTGPFTPGTPQADDTIKPWPFDPDAAKTLLKEAGYFDRNGDGVIDGPDGKPFEIELSYPSTSETYNRVVLFLKDTYAKAGIVLKPNPLEWSVLLQRIEQRQFTAISLRWGGVIETDPYQIFHSSQIAGTGDNVISYANPQLDALIDQARATVDDAKRMAIWHQVHRILHDDQPYTFMIGPKSLIFFDKRIHNIQMTRNGLNSITDWFVPANERKWTPAD
ncbi:MAG: peptide-binding protein [Phycisphaeraceae bacterium]|nr:peptide-binding protein [Phycisphaeraceae bacterium]